MKLLTSNSQLFSFKTTNRNIFVSPVNKTIFTLMINISVKI